MVSTSEAFFKLVIVQYNAGDIKHLLKNSAGLAGPLLAVTVNGIDLLGGMLYGFNTPSRCRSVRFMQEHMCLRRAIAETLYACVRCGIAHEGTPKVRFKFGIFPQRHLPGKIVFRDNSDNSLALNVTELAHAYLDAVNRIAVNLEPETMHLPEPSQRDIKRFEEAFQSVADDVQLLKNAKGRAGLPLSSSTGVWVPQH